MNDRGEAMNHTQFYHTVVFSSSIQHRFGPSMSEFEHRCFFSKTYDIIGQARPNQHGEAAMRIMTGSNKTNEFGTQLQQRKADFFLLLFAMNSDMHPTSRGRLVTTNSCGCN